MEQRAPLQSVLLALLFASLCAGALYLSVGDVNLNLADEGYLWYGVRGVQAGEVPFRDFQAYDPGRYSWCVALGQLFGTGILGIRASLAVFQALGLAAGLLVTRRLFRSDLSMLPMALILALWMFPRHKLFEPALALILLWCVVRMLERPSPRRYLLTGLGVGLAAWFGRNHGLYGGLAAGAAWLYTSWRLRTPGAMGRLFTLATGVLLGYLPMLWQLLFVDGFAAAYGRELGGLAKKGANLPLPWPWPWSFEWGAGAGGMESAGVWATGLAFALPLVILPMALWRVLRREPSARDGAAEGALAPQQAVLPQRAVLIGATILGAIYLHHAAVRSDAQHLAQCIEPLLIAGLALATGVWPQRCMLICLSILTFFFSFQNHSTLRFFAPWKESYRTVPQNVAGETLRLNAGQASLLRALEQNVGERLAPKDEIFIAPTRATFYPLLGKRAPVREIYLLWQASPEEQAAMIERLQEREVRWALILDSTVDGRDDLRFARSHREVWQFLLANYRELPSGLGRSAHLFRRKP